MSLMDRSDTRNSVNERRTGRINGTEFLFGRTNHSYRGADEEFKHICDALLDMRETITSAGGSYAIVFVPEKIRVLGTSCEFPPESSLRDYDKNLSPMRLWMFDWCHKQGIPMLDLTDALIDSTRSGAVPWFPADSHPDGVGHRVSADAIKTWDVVTSWINAQRERVR